MAESVLLPLTYFYSSQSGEKSHGMHNYVELMDTIFNSFDSFLKYDTFICGCGLHIHVGTMITKELKHIDWCLSLNYPLMGSEMHCAVWDYLVAEIKKHNCSIYPCKHLKKALKIVGEIKVLAGTINKEVAKIYNIYV